ncbi:MAG TPA: hypothetical protein VK858_01880 [Longimicrobiales bacterium]|nr:hypothetical protein [Longimicrobiales bacterium]
MRRKTLEIAAVAVVAAAAACGGGGLILPEPRPLVIQSGARLSADEAQLMEIYQWVDREVANIEQDPTFLIAAQPAATDVYPWETLEITADTASIQYRRTNPDLASVYQIYAHLHLMREMGRIQEWMPEAVGADEWEFERLAVARTTDAWLLGRASFGFVPSRLMDELVYAKEAGRLDALLLTLRGHEFPDEKAAWLEARPGAEEDFQAWFRETFDRDINALDF